MTTKESSATRKPGPRPTPTEVLFWTKVERPGPSECWRWLGATDRVGRGVFGTWDAEAAKTRTLRASRYAYELLVGAIPASTELKQDCGAAGCVNPAHAVLRARGRRGRSRPAR